MSPGPTPLPTLTATEESGSVADLTDLGGLTVEDWLVFLGVIVGTLILAKVVSGLIRRIATRSGTNYFVGALIGRTIGGLVVAVGLVYALGGIGIAVGPLLGALGVVGIALAFAFQDILENLIAGVMMMVSRPFEAGDQIEAVEFSGTVEDITLRTVTLRTFDGVRVYLPNAMVWKAPIVNSTELPTMRTNLEIGLGYDTDLDEAVALVTGALGSVDAVLDDPPPEAFVASFGDSAVNIVARFWHASLQVDRWQVRDAVARALKKTLDEAEVDIPFPQRTLLFGDTTPWQHPWSHPQGTSAPATLQRPEEDTP